MEWLLDRHDEDLLPKLQSQQLDSQVCTAYACV
jgi:hypothetical protein